MKKKILIKFILLLFIIGCSDNEDNVLSNFENVIDLKSNVTKIKSSDIGEIVDMLVYDSVLVVNEMFSDKIFKLFNLNSGKIICSCIQSGKGPNEMIYPYTITKYKNDIFTTFDNNKHELFFLSVTDLLQSDFKLKNKEKLDSPDALKAYPVNDSLIVSTGVFKDGRYCLYNKILKKSIIKLDYPYDKEHINDSPLVKGLAFQGRITIKPDQSKFALFAYSSDNFEIVDISNNNLKKIVRKAYDPPKYLTNNHIPKYNKKTAKYAFVSAFSTDKYIYTLYSGRYMKDHGETYYYGKNLLVYNWKGQSVVNFKLDKFLGNICFDEKNMKIYGLSINKITDEPEIISYNLPNH